MRPFWKKKAAPDSSVAAASAIDPDLLARQEEEAFVASVLKKRQERETTSARPTAPIAAEPDGIEWSEMEDVYRPQRVSADFLAALLQRAAPELRRGSSCCLVRRAAYEQIQAHLRSDLRIELGGLLVGEAFFDADRDVHCVLVEDALPAYEGEGTALTFAYTEATWQALSPQMQALPAAWTLLGSYHSHPGMGVFLSSTDLETQRGVFFHDWQIALVIDPIAQEVGFFFGAEGHRCSIWDVI
jgi:proteasome lid subunit RPN8/RPN11